MRPTRPIALPVFARLLAALGLTVFVFVFGALPETQGKQASRNGKTAALKTAHNDQPSVQPTGWSEHSIDIDGTTRWYRVLRSKNYQPGKPAVVFLHGGNQSMRKVFNARINAGQHWQTVAEKEGFLLIAPNGSNVDTGDTKGDRQNWNDYRLEADRANPKTDDVLFIETLVKSLQEKYRFDENRVYVTGASNGGMMTFRMLIDKPALFAAGVSFIASLPADFSRLHAPESSTPLMICNGTDDPLIKWEGGFVGLKRDRGTTCPVEDTVNWWVKTNRCKPKPTSTKLADKDPDDGCRIVRHVYEPKDDGWPLEFVKIEGGGHTLPSTTYSLPDNRLVQRLLGTMCHDIEGAEMAWEFMKQHSRSE